MAAKQNGEARDAVDVLMDDHRSVQKLFRDFEQLDRDDDDAVGAVVERAIAELQVHSMLEEELFYPAVRAQVEDDESEDLLNEAEVEHEAVDELIAKLQELDAGDAMYRAYFTVLSEYVKHHVKEEEKALFPHVRKLRDLDLAQLGRDMESRREELEAEVAAGAAEADNDDELEDEEDAGSSPTRH